MPEGEPSHAEMMASVQNIIDGLENMEERHKRDPSAIGASFIEIPDPGKGLIFMRAVLAHLKRTQPTDTQADLTERARLNYGEAILKGYYTHEDYTKAVALLGRVSRKWGGDRSEVVPDAYRRVAAALQSEREAAAAKARRTALEECATIAEGWASMLGRAGQTTALMIREAINEARFTTHPTGGEAVKERMVPEQEVSDAGEDLVRLAAALTAEIAMLKVDFQNASDAADAYCAEIANWKLRRDTLAATVEERAVTIAALTEQRDAYAERWRAVTRACDEALQERDAVTEQRDRAMAEARRFDEGWPTALDQFEKATGGGDAGERARALDDLLPPLDGEWDYKGDDPAWQILYRWHKHYTARPDGFAIRHISALFLYSGDSGLHLLAKAFNCALRSSHREGAEEARQDALRVPFTKALVAEARMQGYQEGAEAMRESLQNPSEELQEQLAEVFDDAFLPALKACIAKHGKREVHPAWASWGREYLKAIASALPIPGKTDAG